MSKDTQFILPHAWYSNKKHYICIVFLRRHKTLLERKSIIQWLGHCRFWTIII